MNTAKLGSVALVAVALATGLYAAGCGVSQRAPEPATSPAPQSTVDHLRNSPVAPGPSGTLLHWVGVACPSEGATATSTSGGHLVCTKSGTGKDVPHWHADVRTNP
jgi:hypothetical protein